MGKQEVLIIMNLTSKFVANIEFRKIIMHATLKPLPGKLKLGFWVLQEPCRGLMIVLPNWFIVLDLVRKHGLTKMTIQHCQLFYFQARWSQWRFQLKSSFTHSAPVNIFSILGNNFFEGLLNRKIIQPQYHNHLGNDIASLWKYKFILDHGGNMEKGAEKRWKFYAVYAVYKLRNICHCPQGKPHSLCIHCSI